MKLLLSKQKQTNQQKYFTLDLFIHVMFTAKPVSLCKCLYDVMTMKLIACMLKSKIKFLFCSVLIGGISGGGGGGGACGNSGQ